MSKNQCIYEFISKDSKNCKDWLNAEQTQEIISGLKQTTQSVNFNNILNETTDLNKKGQSFKKFNDKMSFVGQGSYGIVFADDKTAMKISPLKDDELHQNVEMIILQLVILVFCSDTSNIRHWPQTYKTFQCDPLSLKNQVNYDNLNSFLMRNYGNIHNQILQGVQKVFKGCLKLKKKDPRETINKHNNSSNDQYYIPSNKHELDFAIKLGSENKLFNDHFQISDFNQMIEHILAVKPNNAESLVKLVSETIQDNLIKSSPICRVVTMEKVQCDLGDWIKNNHQLLKSDQNKLVWQSLFFQVLYILSKIQFFFPTFRHNDFKPNNLLVRNCKETEAEYKVVQVQDAKQTKAKKQYFDIQTFGITIVFWDFDFASIANVVTNPKVEEEWNKQYNISSNMNRFYDTYMFFSSLFQLVQSQKLQFDSETLKFVQLVTMQDKMVYLSKTEGKQATHKKFIMDVIERQKKELALKTVNYPMEKKRVLGDQGPYFSYSNRILSDQEFFLPEELLMNEYFSGLRKK